MTSFCRLLFSIGVAAGLCVAVDARAAVADHDDQFVVRGCVAPTAGFSGAGPQSFLVWSRGNVYLASPDVRTTSQTARSSAAARVFVPVMYWIDDEDDIARYVGQQVEVVGELSDDLDKGKIEIDHHGDFTEIEFEVNGHDAKARIPRTWLGPAIADKDVDFDVVVRTVDVEKVTVLGAC